MKQYMINEIFYSLQGEGIRAGEPSVFIRFSGCNLKCDLKEGPQSPGGFACDTEFVSGRKLTLQEISEWVFRELQKVCGSNEVQLPKGIWLVLTGGEPSLQLDKEFCDYFHQKGYLLAIETNGTVDLTGLDIDWITLSPKVAEHAIKQLRADEIKYVRGYGQGIPKTAVEARYKLISPAFRGNELDKEVLDWCIQLCLANPEWRMSTQLHKAWKVR